MNNRQAGRRNRGRNNNGRPNNNNRGGGDNGNRIDSRARGNAPQLLEKYRNLARDAQLAGDRVNTEYYLQFADHYFRVIADNRQRQEEQQARYRRNDTALDDDDQMMEPQGSDFGETEGVEGEVALPGGYGMPNRQRDRDTDNEAAGSEEDDRRSDRQNAERPSGRGRGRNAGNRRREEGAEDAPQFDASILPPAISDSEPDEAPAPRRRGRRPAADRADTAEAAE